MWSPPPCGKALSLRWSGAAQETLVLSQLCRRCRSMPRDGSVVTPPPLALLFAVLVAAASAAASSSESSLQEKYCCSPSSAAKPAAPTSSSTPSGGTTKGSTVSGDSPPPTNGVAVSVSGCETEIGRLRSQSMISRLSSRPRMPSASRRKRRGWRAVASRNASRSMKEIVSNTVGKMTWQSSRCLESATPVRHSAATASTASTAAWNAAPRWSHLYNGVRCWPISRT
mmetsp:Transcript_54597/g.152346  ORF Transcript_54597/g.152346 Transcript_54597/m.152346 type:complete len:227 (-) Transcript_54597:693-1373(-)